jgi:hypothetical protein
VKGRACRGRDGWCARDLRRGTVECVAGEGPREARVPAYEKFTGLARLDRDVHELEGLLRGIAADGRVLPQEVVALRRWCDQHDDADRMSPFDSLVPRVRAAIEDGVLTDDERADVLWLCERTRTPSAYYSVATSDMQRLHGVLAGIGADGAIVERELRSLREWMEGADHLRGTWPYDEIDGLITGVLSDGKIDEEEHRFLVAFTSEFLRATTNLVLESPFEESLIRFGVCASCPEIVFKDRRFCFTGESPAGARRHLEQVVAQLGGEPLPRVRADLDYLIVGAEGGKSWAFSCYGRKVEAAVKLRKSGARLTIAHEFDFWDAAADHGVERPRIAPPTA